jgi:predicted MFS family arabinose efflux permease
VIEHYGWRAGFWLSGAFGVVVLIAVFMLVPRSDPAHTDDSSPLSQMVEVVRLGLSRPLRGLIALALVSLAAALVLRGLWGGPWLMDVKGLGRIEAGNDLGLFTLAMIAGPVLIGILDRKFGHRRAVLAFAHVFCAVALLLMAGGAPGLFVSNLFGVAVMPTTYDVVLLVLIGFAVSAQPLLYGMTRQLIDPTNAGKALSAINLAFFLGAALMQSVTGIVAVAFGLPAVLIFMALALVAGSIVFLAYT